jgi:glycosyltransferase involved in cell wall biosynthesis
VEASVAGKQAHGPWQLGHRRVIDALGHADLVIGLNRADRDGVLPLLKSPERFRFFPPFIDCRPFAAARLAQHRGRPGGEPLLLAVGMLREGAKLASYRLLASALATLRDRPWRLLIAGDGEAEPQVRAAMAALGERVRFLGRKTEAELPALYASCDIFLWPAIKEAIGMVFIEAQAAGLPVVGAHNLGVPDVVDDGVTGFLPRYGDAGAFAEAVGTLLDDAELRQRMGLAAAGHALACHDIETAGRRFVKAIEDLAR